MAVTKVLARDFTYEINTGTEATPVWTPIGGLTNVSDSPTKNDADTTTYSSRGWLEHIVASRGLQITLEGFRLEDPQTGERDPGQQAVEELARKIGLDSLGQFRITSPGGWKVTFRASAQVNRGGGNDDPDSWSATLTISGEPVWEEPGA